MNQTENIQYPTPKREYKVLVNCATYNHSKYIEDALNGFAVQQTNFPFICLVMDDASTDGEQDVLKAWMERECDMNRAETIDIPTSIVIIVPHKTNPSCTFAFYLLKQNLYRTGKKVLYINPWREKCIYEALCEGDDYWIDPLKLQKQVDFFDKNPEYVMVYTNAKVYYQMKGKMEDGTYGCSDNSYEGLLKYNPIPTLTVLYRIETLKDYHEVINPRDKGWLLGDFPLWLWLSLQGKIKFISEYTGVYRFLDQSASHFKNYAAAKRFALSSISVKEFFMNLYPVQCKEAIDDANYHRLFGLAFMYKDYDDLLYYYSRLRRKSVKDRIKFFVGNILNVLRT